MIFRRHGGRLDAHDPTRRRGRAALGKVRAAAAHRDRDDVALEMNCAPDGRTADEVLNDPRALCEFGAASINVGFPHRDPHEQIVARARFVDSICLRTAQTPVVEGEKNAQDGRTPAGSGT